MKKRHRRPMLVLGFSASRYSTKNIDLPYIYLLSSGMKEGITPGRDVVMVLPAQSFDVTLDEAKRIQYELREQVVLSDTIPDIGRVRIVGGADVAFLAPVSGITGLPGSAPGEVSPEHKRASIVPRTRFVRATHAVAGIVLLDVANGEVIETVHAIFPVRMPYIPGFLSFREGPAILAAFGELSHVPEVMLYDGCGIAHPRGCGLASHMALLTGIPSVGCAKNRLCGTCDNPGNNRGEWTDILFHGEVVGSCVRTRTNVKPVFVSPGNGFSVTGARELVLKLSARYRLPDVIRLAHQLVSREKTEYEKHFAD
ncbi:endonuclease V [Candidatus Latescibacterota bacterium]